MLDNGGERVHAEAAGIPADRWLAGGVGDGLPRVLDMQQFLLEVWTGFKSTILFVTHQIDEAVALADRVVVMSAAPGRVLEEVKIVLPRPRSMATTRDPGFAALFDRIYGLLRDEVMRAMVSGGASA